MANSILGRSRRIPLFTVQQAPLSMVSDKSILRPCDIRLLRIGEDDSETCKIWDRAHDLTHDHSFHLRRVGGFDKGGRDTPRPFDVEWGRSWIWVRNHPRCRYHRHMVRFCQGKDKSRLSSMPCSCILRVLTQEVPDQMAGLHQSLGADEYLAKRRPVIDVFRVRVVLRRIYRHQTN